VPKLVAGRLVVGHSKPKMLKQYFCEAEGYILSLPQQSFDENSKTSEAVKTAVLASRRPITAPEATAQ
jgi:hypothetical protein